MGGSLSPYPRTGGRSPDLWGQMAFLFYFFPLLVFVFVVLFSLAWSGRRAGGTGNTIGFRDVIILQLIYWQRINGCASFRGRTNVDSGEYSSFRISFTSCVCLLPARDQTDTDTDTSRKGFISRKKARNDTRRFLAYHFQTNSSRGRDTCGEFYAAQISFAWPPKLRHRCLKRGE